MIRMTTVGTMQHLVLPPSVVVLSDAQATINFKSSLRNNSPCTCQMGPVFLESEPWLFRVTQSGSAAPSKVGSESEGPVSSVKIREQRNWDVQPQTQINMAPLLLSTRRGYLVVLRSLDWGSPLDPGSMMAIVFFS